MLSRLFARPAQRSEAQHLALRLEDGREVEVRLIRHARARHLRLAVDERGPRLTLPRRGSERAALAFLHGHRDWLLAQLRQLEVDAGGTLQAGITTQLHWRGEDWPLHWRDGCSTRLQQQGDALCFELRGGVAGAQALPASSLRRALHDFCRAGMRADIGRWLPELVPGLPQPPSRLVIKPMTSQWGSLSAAGVVALDLSLALARPSALHYVLVHELCHLIHRDHSPAFWREVAARRPDWRNERDYLHREGRRIKARLHRLAG